MRKLNDTDKFTLTGPFSQFRIFGGINFANQTADKISTFRVQFQIKSKWESRNSEFNKQSV